MSFIYNFVIPLDDDALNFVRSLCLNEKGHFTFSTIPPANGSGKEEPAESWTEDDDYIGADLVSMFDGKGAFCFTIEDMTVVRSVRKRFADQCQGACVGLRENDNFGESGKQVLIKDGTIDVQYEWGCATYKSIPITMDVNSEEENLNFDLCDFVYTCNIYPITRRTARWYYSYDWKNYDCNPLYMIVAVAGEYEALILICIR